MVNPIPKRSSRREPPGELIEFGGRRAEHGYRIELGPPSPPELYPPQIRYGWQVDREAQEVLVPKSAWGDRSPALTEPGLFRMFAELKTTDEIRAFAGEFGPLHGFGKRGFQKADGGFADGESVAWWKYSIAQVASAVRLLDGSRGEGDVEEYFGTYSYSQGQGIAYFSHSGVPHATIERLRGSYDDDREEWLAGQELPIGFYWHPLGDFLEVLTAYERKDFRYLALRALGERLNGELRKPSYHSPKWLGPHVGIKPTLFLREDRYVLRLVTPFLLDLIWVQVAQAATGGREYRKCESCPRWFAVVEYGRQRRSDRIYCSAACKTRAFREKRAKQQGERA